ncbi:MAG: sugar kinase [Phenylobacterium sp.]|uniref:sugar kinase n=1 Tax=Phenylobacterium sp. TaxID=1871053 RepID=UPI003918857D
MSPGRIVCFGEVLLRLSAPGAGRLLQSPQLDVCVGGAEANVAVSLARFGREAAVVSLLPDNALGRAARDELRRHGVDTSGVRFAPGRMGLYFLSPGAVLRPSEVTYDRAGSAFAVADPGAVDWETRLSGAAWLHLSGVTPAIGAGAAEAAVRAAREARRLGVKVSFDGNFRATMWAAWQGDAPAILRAIFECADVAFADERDIGLVLGGDYSRGSVEERRRRAAEAAFAAFPNLQRLAATVRTHHGVDRQDLSATLATREAWITTKAYPLGGIVDRIGAGDAFAAGVLHGLLGGESDRASLEFGLAAAVLKHSIPGDFNLVQEAEVRALVAGDGLDVKR